MMNFDDRAIPGRKIILHSMPDDFSTNPIPPETEGTIKSVDGIGQISVDWHEECSECFGDGSVGRRECPDCGGKGTKSIGRSLAVIPGIDDYTILENKYIKQDMKKIKKYDEFLNEELREDDLNRYLDKVSGGGELTPEEKADMDEYSKTGEFDNSPEQEVTFDTQGDIRVDGERMNPYGIDKQYYDDGVNPSDVREVTPELEKEISYFLNDSYRKIGAGVVDNDTDNSVEGPVEVQRRLQNEFGIPKEDSIRIVFNWWYTQRNR